MLVISRRVNEEFLFPSLGITIKVIKVAGKVVRIGIDAPDDIRVIRAELIDELIEITAEPDEVLEQPKTDVVSETCSDYEISSEATIAPSLFDIIIEQLKTIDDEIVSGKNNDPQLNLDVDGNFRTGEQVAA